MYGNPARWGRINSIALERDDIAMSGVELETLYSHMKTQNFDKIDLHNGKMKDAWDRFWESISDKESKYPKNYVTHK